MRSGMGRRSSSDKSRSACSSSQASLAKILRTISSFRPCGAFKERDSEAKSEETSCRGRRAPGIDLNRGLGYYSTDFEDSSIVGDGGFSDCSAVDATRPAVAGRSSQGECGSNSAGAEAYGHEYACAEDGRIQIREKKIEASDTVNPEAPRGPKAGKEEDDAEIIVRQKKEEEGGGGNKREMEEEPSDGENGLEMLSIRFDDGPGEGYIGLLIEAARLISDDFGDAKPPEATEVETKKKPSRRGGPMSPVIGGTGCLERAPAKNALGKRGRAQAGAPCGREGAEGASPAGRTKRGRSRLLPHRFRDSVLHSWNPGSRAGSAVVPPAERWIPRR